MALDLTSNEEIAQQSLKIGVLLKAAGIGKSRKELINLHAASIVTIILVEAMVCGHDAQELLQEVEVWMEETLGFLTKEILPFIHAAR